VKTISYWLLIKETELRPREASSIFVSSV